MAQTGERMAHTGANMAHTCEYISPKRKGSVEQGNVHGRMFPHKCPTVMFVVRTLSGERGRKGIRVKECNVYYPKRNPFTCTSLGKRWGVAFRCVVGHPFATVQVEAGEPRQRGQRPLLVVDHLDATDDGVRALTPLTGLTSINLDSCKRYPKTRNC